MADQRLETVAQTQYAATIKNAVFWRSRRFDRGNTKYVRITLASSNIPISCTRLGVSALLSDGGRGVNGKNARTDSEIAINAT